ncbi:hypothetical protein FRC00_001639 [Tulasnella sp. 408]|nr:hypothetical protein FRC00_001639 [Tulasnella sp. 408]
MVPSSSPLRPQPSQPSSPTANKPPMEGQAHSNSPRQAELPSWAEEIARQLGVTSESKPGDWLVVLAQRALRRIRQVSSDKNDLLLRIQKKIKQLSVGYFPPPNQTKLLDDDSLPAIFTADVGEGFHLIYIIDFGAPINTEEESQFIRVFDMLPEAEIDRKFWRSVATQLALRGSEYMNRCSDRAEPRIRFKGRETVPPKVFPPLSVSEEKDEADFEAIPLGVSQEKYGAEFEANKEDFLEA